MRPEATPPPFPIEAPSQAPFARQQSFGVLPDGREVERWILGNRHGLVSTEASLSLALPSPDGDLGYPGAIDISATFSVTDDNAVCFATEVCSDRPTPVSLTQHAYFNLTGEHQRDVLQHELEVAAGHYVPAGNDMLPSHEKTSLAGQAPDLRMAKRLGDVVPALWQEHGELYWLGASPELRTVARLWEPQNAILLTVDTTQTCLQTYFGAALADQNGSRWPRFGGLCLECQGYPAASNVDGFGDIIVRPGQPQRHETRFQFSQNPQTLTHSTPQP
jgi:aldose 1-epimerase